jgi:O-antigen/teichoic acid export membrane protein
VLRRLAINTGTNFAFRIFTFVLQLASVPIIVNATSSEAYGLLLLANSVMGYFDLMKSGFPAGMVKFVSEYEAKDEPEQVARIINTSTTFYLGIGVLTALGTWVFTEAGGLSLFNISAESRSTAVNVVLIAGGLAVVKWPSTGLGQALDGLQRYAENNLYKGLGRLLGVALSIAAALLGYSLEVIFLLQSIDLLLSSVFQYRLLRILQPHWHLNPLGFDRETFRMIFGYSVWMLVNQLASLLIYQTDRIILGLFLPVSSLTTYHVVTMPFKIIKQLNSLYHSALLPVISSEDARSGRSGLDRFIYLLSRYTNAFIAPLAVLGFFLSESFIRVWMGADFVQYAWIAEVACIAQLLRLSNATLGQVCYGTGKVERLTGIAITTAVLNVFLGVWWVQLFGVAGVVFSTIAASLIGLPLQYVFVLPQLEVNRSRYLVQAVLRGQWLGWIGGILLLARRDYLSALDSWAELVVIAGILGLLFYGPIWFVVVKKTHRDNVHAFIRHDLLAPLLRS